MVIIELYIHQGDVNVNPAYSSEDSGKGDEMPTQYDVLIDCVLPSNGKVCRSVLDLKTQGENGSKYSVPMRGVQYCCRLISRQLDSLDKEAACAWLKPVYSVWIWINNVSKELRNSIYSVDLSVRLMMY